MKIKNFFNKYGDELQISLVAGERGLNRTVLLPEIERPGLKLVGYLNGLVPQRGYIFGKLERDFLKTCDSKKRLAILKKFLVDKAPFIFFSHNIPPFKEIISVCEERCIPLFRSPLPTMLLMSRVLSLLTEELAPNTSCHGSLVDIFGIGILIQGEASIGKSVTALSLIKRGHRFISDDIVKLKKREGKYLEGYGIDISRNHMEIKGIGIINIAKMYGAASIQEKKSLDIVVKLEVWDDSTSYEDGIKEKTISLLGVDVPYHLIHVNPSRDTVLLIETIALNYRIKTLETLEHQVRSWNNI